MSNPALRIFSQLTLFSVNLILLFSIQNKPLVQVIGASRLIYQLVVLVALGIFHFSLMGIHMIHDRTCVLYYKHR